MRRGGRGAGKGKEEEKRGKRGGKRNGENSESCENMKVGMEKKKKTAYETVSVFIN